MGHDSKVDRLRAFLARGEWDQLMIRDAILEAKLPSACKLTLSAIVSHHSSARPCPTVGIRRLAALTSTKPDTVVAALRKLELMGLVEVSRANRTINTYDLTGTISGLLAVSPFRTAVPIERTEPVLPNGTVSVSPEGNLSRSGEPICPDRGLDLSQTGERMEPGRNQMKEPDCASQSDTPPLALENPSPSKPKRRARSKPKATTDAPDPRVPLLRDHYVTEYERTKQSKPVLTAKQWPRAMRSFKELLEATKELDSAKRIVTRAFEDSWHRNNKCQPWEIVANANKFTGRSVARTKPNGTHAPQDSGVDVVARWGTEA